MRDQRLLGSLNKEEETLGKEWGKLSDEDLLRKSLYE